MPSEVGQAELNTELFVKNSQVRQQTKSSDDTRITSSWFITLNQDGLLKGDTIGTSINNGALIFSVQGNQVSGQIDISGTTWLKQPGTYRAKFTGQKQEQSLTVSEQIPPSEAPAATETVPHADNVKKIQGNRIPVIFNISLQGKTEAKSFGPLAGILFIGSFPPGNPNPVSIHLLSNSGRTNGSISWSFEQSGKAVPDTHTQLNNDQIRVEFKPSKQIRPIFWNTAPADASANQTTIPVQGEAGTLTLTITGNHISGQVRAFGLYNQDSKYNQQSTYEATLTGEIQKSRLVEKLRDELTKLTFNGRWTTDQSDFEQIELQQDGQEVKGRFTGRGGGSIEGVIQGNRLNFTWKDNERRRGWGFLRAITSGGSLAGFWGQGTDTAKTQSLIATWQPPTILNTQISDPIDIQELRSLGQDLAIQNKCEQAVAVLNKTIAFYKAEQQKKETKDQTQETYLINEAKTLSYLTNCNSRLGRYERFLENLEYALEVEHLLGPDVSSSRLFRELTASLTKELSSTSKTLKLLQTNINSLQETMNLTGIGVQLNQDEKTQNLVIAAIVEGAPAAKVGIIPQDVIVKIDGQSIKGMNVNTVLQRLRGSVGTQVALKVQRGNRQLDFKLSRDRVDKLSTQRQTELTQTLSFLSNYFQSLRASLSTELNHLNILEQRIARGQEDAVKVLESVPSSLASQRKKLRTEIDEIIALGKKTFKAQKELFQYLDLLFKQFNFEGCEIPSNFNLKDLANMDEKFNRSLESNHELTKLEKDLVREHLKIVLSLYTLSLQLECKRNFIAQLDVRTVFDNNRKQAQESLTLFADSIEDWRARLVKDLDKISALDKGQPFFQKLIPLLVELRDEKGSLVASEKSRARAFSDLLATRLADNPTIQKSANSPNIQQIQQIAKTQASTLVEYAIIHEAGKESSLFIWVVKPTGEIMPLRKVDLKSLQSTLKQLFKEPHCLETSNSSLQAGNAFATLIKETHCHILAASYSSDDASLKLRQLYQLLIQPINDYLPKDPNSRIIFIPQRELFIVPFASLLDTDGKYLIEKHTILTAPSIQVLDSTYQLRKKNAGRANGALVVGNPMLAPELIKQYSSLAYAEKEAIEIAKRLNVKPIIGKYATKELILKQLPQAKIIHLATHALANDDRGLESWIALAPSSNNNGLLLAEEILKLYGTSGTPLRAELIVLSACTTAQGQLTGDGVIGLSRSLIASGIPSVIVSLWSVQDNEATVFLMQEFYNNLHFGKAQALRKAMLKTMAKYPNKPGVWAEFILIGEAE